MIRPVLNQSKAAATGQTPTPKPAPSAGEPAVALSTIEKTLGEIAARGVHPEDLPAAHRIQWAPVLAGKFRLTPEKARLIADFLPKERELQDEISQDSTDATLARWRAEQTEARGDDAARAALEDKRTALATARLRRKAAKAALGELRGALAKELVPAGRRLLETCEAELARLAEDEAKLCARFGLPNYVSPLRFAAARSLQVLRETLARDLCPPALLEHFAGELLPPPAK